MPVALPCRHFSNGLERRIRAGRQRSRVPAHINSRVALHQQLEDLRRVLHDLGLGKNGILRRRGRVMAEGRNKFHDALGFVRLELVLVHVIHVLVHHAVEKKIVGRHGKRAGLEHREFLNEAPEWGAASSRADEYTRNRWVLGQLEFARPDESKDALIFRQLAGSRSNGRIFEVVRREAMEVFSKQRFRVRDSRGDVNRIPEHLGRRRDAVESRLRLRAYVHKRSKIHLHRLGVLQDVDEPNDSPL
mmetsp:Transcript_11316/g.29861  ORF Transcript_11316/g.29861 Transcript_11316/m.29861 type:complete len:246 (-) Transcript_11316:868-1605(-)